MTSTKAAGIHSHPSKKLGRKPQDEDRRAIRFGALLKTVPDHPLSVDDAGNFRFAMDGNDKFGDCVVAGWDHTRQIITGLLTGSPLTYTQDEIWAMYKTQNPNFNPALSESDPRQEDNGMVIQLFLEYLRKQGEIIAFARIDHNNDDELRAAIYLGLAVMIGVDLKTAQQTQQTWDYVPGASEWGGHCVAWSGYQPSTYRCVTWGALVDMTINFVKQQCDEAWFVLTQAHVDHPDFRQYMDLEKFAEAFQEITGEQFPVSPTPTPPQPTPTPTPTEGITFQVTDPKLIPHIERSVARSPWNGDATAWLEHHLGHYFDL